MTETLSQPVSEPTDAPERRGERLAAWRPVDVTLTPSEQAELARLGEECCTTWSLEDLAKRSNQRRMQAELESSEIWRSLGDRVRDAIATAGVVRLRGVPVQWRSLLVGLVGMVGTATKRGNVDVLIFELRPKVDADQDPEMAPLTLAPLALHMDGSHFKVPQRHLALACVRGDAPGSGSSTFLRVDRVVELLREQYGDACVQALQDPAYPMILEGIGEGETAGKAPILVWTDEGFVVKYRGDSLRREIVAYGVTLSAEHAEALAAWEAMLAANAEQVVCHLEPGDVVIFDNWRVLHGRTALAPGSDRLILRLKTRGTS